MNKRIKNQVGCYEPLWINTTGDLYSLVELLLISGAISLHNSPLATHILSRLYGATAPTYLFLDRLTMVP